MLKTTLTIRRKLRKGELRPKIKLSRPRQMKRANQSERMLLAKAKLIAALAKLVAAFASLAAAVALLLRSIGG